MELSSRVLAVVVDDSNAVLSSPTRPNVGRSLTLVLKPLELSNRCCCSNWARRSSMMDDDDDERRGGCGRSSSVRVAEITVFVVSRERAV